MRLVILFVLLSAFANAAFVGEVTSNDIVTYTNPSNPPPSSNRGGGGSGCSVYYVCGDWGECINETQIQECYDSCNKKNKTYSITCDPDVNVTTEEVVDDEHIIEPPRNIINKFKGILDVKYNTPYLPITQDFNLDIPILILALIYLLYELVMFVSIYKGR